jgi:hypothetical protein
MGLPLRKIADVVGCVGVMLLMVGALLSCSSAPTAGSTGGGKREAGPVKSGPVYVLPELTGGVAGWCITIHPGLGCPVEFFYKNAIVAENWVAVSHPMHFEGFALVQRRVTAVAVNGSRIATRADASLPDGLREVSIAIPGWPGPKATIPALFPGRKPKEVPRVLPRFRALGDVPKQPMMPSVEAGWPIALTARGRSWRPSESEPWGICQLSVSRESTKLTSGAGFVVTAMPRIKHTLGEPFLSCVSRSFTVDGWPVVGSVLINARHPDRRPGDLPYAKPLAPNLLDALGSNGPMVARRVRGAWLVVSGGEGEAQRRMLLEHLYATVHL